MALKGRGFSRAESDTLKIIFVIPSRAEGPARNLLFTRFRTKSKTPGINATRGPSLSSY